MIEIGDIVRVNFNNAQFCLTEKAEVIHRPFATGDSWMFKDIETGVIHAVSEGCTITKLNEPQQIPSRRTDF